MKTDLERQEIKMARPAPKILLELEVGDGSTWQILQAEAYYAITYDGEPIGIKKINASMTNNGTTYKKMTYTNLGNAQAQVVRLNHRFKTTLFEVMMIGID